MRRILVAIASLSFGITAFADMTPLIRLDFNDEQGNSSLRNRGSIEQHASFGGRGSHIPDFTEKIPPQNSGGRSIYFAWSESGTRPEGQYVVMDHVPQLNNLVSLTVTGWLYVEPDVSGETPTRIIDWSTHVKDGVHPQNTGFVLWRNSENQIYVQAGSRENPISFGANYEALIPTGEWVFFAVTLDASREENNLHLYYGNGSTVRLASSRPMPVKEGHIGANEVELFIGNTHDYKRAWAGYMDNLRIYGSTTDGSAALDIPALEAIMVESDTAPTP